MLVTEAVMELPRKGATEVSKILSVEGFGGGSESREGVGVGKDPGFGRVSVGRCTNYSNDMTCRTNASEQNSVSRSKKSNPGHTIFNNSLPSYVDAATASQVGKPLFMGKQLHRKSGKTSKDITFSSKRPRSEHDQVSMSQGGFGDCNGIVSKHKSVPRDERSLAIGHKHNLDGKRGDKRCFKSPKRPKEDPFHAKIGLIKSSSSGGGNILGMYGLKLETQEVTRHIDELSLDDLLDDNYKPPTFFQTKGKSAANTNENLVDTIRKACSVLQSRKPVETRSAELDSSSNRNVDTCESSSGSSVASGTDCTKGDNKVEDLATSSKDECAVSITSTLAEPKDILEQIALPPATKLDALLLDTHKSAVSRVTNELWISRTMTFGASLQPFPWSHCSVGPSKKAIDTGKLPNNRSRWIRIGSIVNSPNNAQNLIDMSSLDFDNKSSITGSDPSIVRNALPQRFSGSSDWQVKPDIEMENSFTVPKEEAGFTRENVGLMVPSLERQKFLGYETNYTDSKQPKRQSNGNFASNSHFSPLKSLIAGLDPHDASEKLIHAGHSPRLVTASLTLYEMSRRPATENPKCRKFRWPKKATQKTMKARKPRSTGKPEPFSGIPKLVLGHKDSVKGDKVPSKKLKYSDNKKLDIRHTNHVGRDTMKWSIPTSSRSPPTRSDNVEAKRLNSDGVKLGTTPSCKRGLDKGRDNELRKAVPMDWGRGKNKN